MSEANKMYKELRIMLCVQPEYILSLVQHYEVNILFMYYVFKSIVIS